MEKYQSCFDDEEIDLPIFLTMSESDLEGIGVSTLGARRKLKIAISGEREGGRGRGQERGGSTCMLVSAPVI